MHNKLVALAQYTVSVNQWRQSFSSRCFLAVEHSAVEVMSAPSFDCFRKRPKTHLFSRSFTQSRVVPKQ